MKTRTVVCNEDSLILGIYEDDENQQKLLSEFLKNKNIVSRKEKIVKDIKRIKITIK